MAYDRRAHQTGPPSAVEVGSPPFKSDDWEPLTIADFFDDQDITEAQNTNLASSFARDFYSSSGSELEVDFLQSNGSNKLPPKLDPFGRALERMHFLTDSQVREVLENCGLEVIKSEGKEEAIMKIMIWRDKRGDFTMDEHHDDDEYGTVDGCIHDDELIMMLPLYMENVFETTMQYGLLKPDLQLECLLRSIPYEGAHTKTQLISKLIHFKDTLFSNSNTLQLLEEQARSSASSP